MYMYLLCLYCRGLFTNYSLNTVIEFLHQPARSNERQSLALRLRPKWALLALSIFFLQTKASRDRLIDGIYKLYELIEEVAIVKETRPIARKEDHKVVNDLPVEVLTI